LPIRPLANLPEGVVVRWWGVGRGYFRNAVAVVLFLLLAATLVLLLVLRQALQPLIIAAQRDLPPLSERTLVRSDSAPNAPTLGDWMVFAAVCDSCIAMLHSSLSAAGDTCERAERIYRRVQRELASQLNRYGWSAAEFRAYERLALAVHRDSIPSAFRWMLRCRSLPKPRSAVHSADLDSLLEQHVRQMLRGRLWWIELGLSSDPTSNSSDDARN
jgi:hypothetical protein